jgi:hypothetical protein
MTMVGLTKRTEQQRADHIRFLTKKPIRDLWKLASLVKAQQKFTFDRYVHATKQKAWEEIVRLEHASAELNEMERDVSEAIDRK